MRLQAAMKETWRQILALSVRDVACRFRYFLSSRIKNPIIPSIAVASLLLR